MSEYTSTGSQARGRTFRVLVYGDTADEIELAALDKAREFFGDEWRLHVVNDYEVHAAVTEEDRKYGKKYLASVRVRTVEPGEPE